jgi:hypothetical protein
MASCEVTSSIRPALDVGTKFAFDASAFGPHFTVFPSEGFVSPNQDVKLEITFHPTQLDPDIRVERVKCTIEGRGFYSSVSHIILSCITLLKARYVSHEKRLHPAGK